ncbi:unnamed protein product, partial [Ascophyllum nodosum]
QPRAFLADAPREDGCAWLLRHLRSGHSRFVCRDGFHEDVLDSVYVPILRYCCTRIQYFALEITRSYSGKRIHRDKIPPQRMHAACRIVTRGSCCAKR